MYANLPQSHGKGTPLTAIRTPAVAGTFYPADRDLLGRQLSLFLSGAVNQPAAALPKAIIGSPAFSAASVLSRRPPQPAEIAQARVFERLLQAECAELQELAHRIAGDKYQQPEPNDSRPSGELTQIRARIDEVHGLLQALQGRFPRPVPDGDR